jgi:hypothetical protein
MAIDSRGFLDRAGILHGGGAAESTSGGLRRGAAVTAPARPAIGLLMLETRFPRPAGDVGNPNTFDFPLLVERVPGARVDRVIDARARGLLGPFVAAGRRLVERGAVAIGTSCGFLVLHQRALAAALPVPVATSSLLQLPWVQATLPPGARCGVVTFDARALGAEHLEAAGAPADTPVAGLRAGDTLRRAIAGDAARIDLGRARAEVVAAAQRLVERHPEVGAIVLECTNLPPYRAAIRAATGRPVFDGNTLLAWLWSAFAMERR